MRDDLAIVDASEYLSVSRPAHELTKNCIVRLTADPYLLHRSSSIHGLPPPLRRYAPPPSQTPTQLTSPPYRRERTQVLPPQRLGDDPSTIRRRLGPSDGYLHPRERDLEDARAVDGDVCGALYGCWGTEGGCQGSVRYVVVALVCGVWLMLCGRTRVGEGSLYDGVRGVGVWAGG